MEYDYIEPFDKHTRLAAKKNEKWNIFKKDSLLPEAKSDDHGFEFERMIEHLVVWQDGYIGLLNEDGKAVTAFEFEEAKTFEGGYSAVAKPDGYLWALVNYEGQILTPFKYTDVVKHYTWDYTLAKVSGRYGIIDHEGKELTDFNFQNIGQFYFYNDEIGLYNIVIIDGKSGIIDREGQLTVPAIYDKFKGRYPDMYGRKNGEWIRIKITPKD